MPELKTTTSPIDPKTLIDAEAIRAADAARDATNKAVHEARQSLNAATKALAAATAAADAAAASNGDLLAAEGAVQHSELVLRAAERRARAAEAAHAEAPRLHREAVGRAHRHAVFDAVERRLAACRAAEDADRAKKKAEADFAAATKDMLNFVNLGAPLRGGVHAPQYLQTEAAERKYWDVNQASIEDRVFFPGEVA